MVKPEEKQDKIPPPVFVTLTKVNPPISGVLKNNQIWYQEVSFRSLNAFGTTILEKKTLDAKDYRSLEFKCGDQVLPYWCISECELLCGLPWTKRLERIERHMRQFSESKAHLVVGHEVGTYFAYSNLPIVEKYYPWISLMMSRPFSKKATIELIVAKEGTQQRVMDLLNQKLRACSKLWQCHFSIYVLPSEKQELGLKDSSISHNDNSEPEKERSSDISDRDSESTIRKRLKSLRLDS